MNILILFSQPWRVGGAETHVQALIQGLGTDHKIILAVNSGSSQDRLDAFRVKYPAVQILEIQARGVNIFRWSSDILKLTELVRDNHIDIISAQQRTAGLWAYIISKMTKIPFLVTMHDSWHRAFAKKVYRHLFRQMIAVSRTLAERLTGDFGFTPDKITVINNGIDFAEFTPQEQLAARLKLDLDVNAKIILHVSRLSSIKGEVSLVLLKSTELLAKYNAGCQIIIIGEGPLRLEVERLANEINKTSQIKILIKNFTSDIKTWYASADVVIAEGRVAIESLACHRPVVAIRNGHFFFGTVRSKNIIEAMKVNFDGRNFAVTPENLVRQIEEAFTICEIEKLTIYEQLKSRMSIAAMTEDYLAIFRKSIEETGYETN